MEVVVETAVQRRDPAEVPSHTPLVRDELVERRARHHDERDIVVLEVRDAAGDAVGDRRAAWTTFGPVRIEHEVIHEHLRTPAEQIAQRRIAVFGGEPIVLLNPHPGQLLPPARQFVAAPRQRLLGLEQLQPGRKPFFTCSGLVIGHCFSPSCGCSGAGRGSCRRCYESGRRVRSAGGLSEPSLFLACACAVSASRLIVASRRSHRAARSAMARVAWSRRPAWTW